MFLARVSYIGERARAFKSRCTRRRARCAGGAGRAVSTLQGGFRERQCVRVHSTNPEENKAVITVCS